MTHAPAARVDGGGAAGVRDLDLVVVGEINPDVIVRAADPRPAFGQVEQLVDAIELVVGSSSVIAACGAARLGLRTGFVGIAGDDAFGRFMVAEMADHGLDLAGVTLRPGLATGATVVLSGPADRAILTVMGAIPLLRASDVPIASLARARHLHVGSAFLLNELRPELPGLLRAAHEAGLTTSVDPNWDPSGAWDGGMAAILAETDVFLPNAAEAMRLTGASTTEDAARLLAAAGPRVVAVKAGPGGGLAATREGDLHRVPAIPVEVVDSTGAGDSFDAGFLAGWLLGRDVPGALALAVACGSLSTLGIGGTAAQPSLADADAAARALGAAAEAGSGDGPAAVVAPETPG